MPSLRERLLEVAYALLTSLFALRSAWLSLKQRVSEIIKSFIASHPRLSSLLGRISGTGRQRGSAPRQPTVLAAILVQPPRDTQDEQALVRILTWARQQGFRHVLVYDAEGKTQQRRIKLIESLRWVAPAGSIAVTNGWQPQPGSDVTLPPGSVAVAILSAADAERPLAEAARAQTRKDSIETMHGERDTLQEALAAPAGVKAQMEAVAGPTAVLEPDMVLIFGGTLTLAGFPPWAVRTSELFDVGRLGEVTGSKLDAALRRYLGTRQRFGR